MRNFHTAALERNKIFTSNFTTHPYECGWASEAIFFVDITELEGSEVSLKFNVQISADGVKWIDEGSAAAAGKAGMSFVRVSRFGGWLRLNVAVDGRDVSGETTIHLVLK
jgi:hypothetical protein